ncbi:hypothetical protein KAFR_0G03500 [Kazachstania africana CBS 2517]|uniref:Zn(2)-C6 fungal-type domain-containing protein n=1 Tax=Kazachstania africana (strain ATCC 22294 / BCRC 22015 / CBS 2517 / CECT 1963 / NBRC 1671 / NRRL Y-8276) TaxID=1071382 RepID=H2AYD2_KAZAF|nr:hypothetical protein KAFR_0G03500 [Kazachstania africana CBS 2517]CCF59382.1 hypothetical protein KAFR_0G03500 [Kazachstania africana CBS 2517]
MYAEISKAPTDSSDVLSSDSSNNNSSSTISQTRVPGTMMEEPAQKKKKKGRRKNTSIACVNCSKWHVSCDSSRPCKRCVSKGLEDKCIDAPRKKSKYLAGIPDDALPLSVRSSEELSKKNSERFMAPLDGRSQSSPESQQYSKPNYIVHKAKFASNAADSEYSILSNIIHKDRMFNRIPINRLFSQKYTPGSTSPNELSSGMNTTSTMSTSTSPPRQDLNMFAQTMYNNNSNRNNQLNNSRSSITASSSNENLPEQHYPSLLQNVYSIILGPQSQEIVNSQINLFTHHFPLVPVETQTNSLNFKRLMPLDPTTSSILQKDSGINQFYLNNESTTFPEVASSYKTTKDMPVSFALQCTSPEVFKIRSNPDWPHSLRYERPMEIYTLINEPFAHTEGFHHLFLYLNSRFAKKDLVEMCRRMAEFRPIFIACSVTLTEEDMIFMEQCYQRTLLEYAKFIEQIGTPTCIWRRNGQISYVNEEFEILSGWKREELLNKMTFIVEILDDESVRDYFNTFASVAYKDFKGSERMKTCRVLTPIKGQVIDCCCLWTLKRDISGFPLMILGNFMPIMT